MGAAHERHDAALEVAAVEPLEPRVIEIHLVQRRLLGERAVEVAHPVLDAAMLGVLEQVPVEALVVVPFAPLRRTRSP